MKRYFYIFRRSLWCSVVTVMCVCASFFFTGCDADIYAPADSQLVVEGWIEHDGFPVVMVSRTLPLNPHLQSLDSLSQYIVKWAAVSVTDGIDTVYLTGKYDAGYFPPYVYTTTRMRGVAGRTYELCVDWQDYHATAQTVIPSAPAVDSFSVKRVADSDSLFVVEATITDPAAEKNYYQLYSRVGGSARQYLAAYLGTFNDDVMKRPATVPVYRGHRAGTGQQYIPYFKLGDTVSVKVAHIGADAFRFWSDYNSVFSESGNVLFAPSHGVRGNMVGAHGYWQGQNACTAYFIIPHRL